MVLHNVLASTLKSFFPDSLSVGTVLDFVRSLGRSLPSSSGSPPTLRSLSEFIIDALWSLDLELDDPTSDNPSSVQGANRGDSSAARDTSTVLQADRATLVELARGLLVR